MKFHLLNIHLLRLLIAVVLLSRAVGLRRDRRSDRSRRCCSWDSSSCGETPDNWCHMSAINCEGSCSGKFIRPLSEPKCCSWNFADCGATSDDWCHQSATNCEDTCGGEFISPSTRQSCTPRWEGCNDHSEDPTSSDRCCGASQCVSYDIWSRGCEIPYECCSWDYGSCGEDDWCNGSAENCAICQGFWINPFQKCNAMWVACNTNSDCCGNALCLTDQNGWQHCNLPQNLGLPVSPTKPPTSPAPTNPSPTNPAPTNPPPTNPPPTNPPPTNPPPTNPPPTNPPPTNPPPTNPPPTNPLPTPPAGGLIGPDNNSEIITIRRPSAPQDTSQKTNCPHEAGGLVLWTTLFSSPSTNQNVNIPANSRVVIQSSVSTRLGIIDIPPTSELIIGENTNGIKLDIAGMNVRGKFTIGSETCRITTKVTITLYGNRPNNVVNNAQDPTYKGISVNGGTISLHGKRYFRTWTRLAATAQPGDTFLRLQEDVNWESNQEIVLVTTAMKDSKEWHENEVLRVESVDNRPPIGSIIYLQSAIQYKHVGIQAYQAEVGLLTRTILIQGFQGDSEPGDSQPRTCRGRWIYGSTDEPCPNKDLTGYGGHIIIHNNGRGYVQGVELFRMGQTNVLGRYPIHFHLLQNCAECFFRDSSVHRSYYRCVSVHGTNYMTVAENVAFDVTGYCYYLEDGVEQYNKIHFNLAAHVHMLGPEIPHGGGQTTQIFQQSGDLTLPADVTASGFYITNIRNEIIGNAASGGWSGFAFPNLPTPIGQHRDVKMRPSSVMPLQGDQIDGNTAHSSGWWWYHAGAFYFGGSLYFNDKNVLEYNPGRDFDFLNHGRETCAIDLCAQGDCSGWCPREHQAFVRLTNSKAFLAPSVGLNSWSGRMEIVGYECHDCGLSLEALAAGFWIDNMLAQCRTGEPISLPPGAVATQVPGNGFGWYDTDQEHIITRSTFRNCGSPRNGRGCDDDEDNVETGCGAWSTVFSFLTHSSEFNPEIMQGTRDITLENCGRLFTMLDFRGDPSLVSVSARLQNWLDEDGSVTGFGERSVIASAIGNGMWWKPDRDSELGYDADGPVHFLKLTNGPERGLGHFRLLFDENEHSKVGTSICTNGGYEPCPALGYIKHMGPMFASDAGLAVTAQADIVGPVGGFGWLLQLNMGAPKQLRVELIEVRPDTPLMLHIAYPPGTSFDIKAVAPWCGNGGCAEKFSQVGSVGEVRSGPGNRYYVSEQGLLSIRIIQFSGDYIANDAGWIFPTYDMTYPWNPNDFVLDRFERGGVLLPKMSYGPFLQINANCGGTTYCNQRPPVLNPNPCNSGFNQIAFDKCCSGSQCRCANGNLC